MPTDVESRMHWEDQRRKAFLADVVAILRRQRNDLLSFEAAQEALHAYQQSKPITETIPVDKIVGSVGRYRDFTRAFLPRGGVDPERWQRLDLALSRLENVPAIDVYQLGDVYFVRDGNHRVSVARANGAKYIEARVTRVSTRVPLTAGYDPDALGIIQEYDSFLNQTNLDLLRPQQRIFFSAPGHYRVLLEHIAVHRYYMGLDLKRDVSQEEAVADWYDKVYEPIVQAVRKNDILGDFPGRTEADLYLWIIDHHYYLSKRYRGITLAAAVASFRRQFGGNPLKRGLRALWHWARRLLERWFARPAGEDGGVAAKEKADGPA